MSMFSKIVEMIGNFLKFLKSLFFKSTEKSSAEGVGPSFQDEQINTVEVEAASLEPGFQIKPELSSEGILQIPESVTSFTKEMASDISEYLDVNEVKQIVLPNGIRIEDGAFSVFASLEQITLPSTFGPIPDGAFGIDNDVVDIAVKEVKLLEAKDTDQGLSRRS